jgi:hypothetical protein
MINETLMMLKCPLSAMEDNVALEIGVMSRSVQQKLINVPQF